jgi:hypothetical protein
MNTVETDPGEAREGQSFGAGETIKKESRWP